MYLYTFLALLAVKAVEPSCNRGSYNAANHVFHSLSNQAIAMDQKIQDVCKQFPQFASREVFGNNAFRIEVMLPEFSQAHFDVRIKHRVIYINGHDPRQGQTCDLTYVDVKVLPAFVKTHEASWTLKDGQFIVALPYNYRINEYSMGCSQSIDETILHVRRGFPSDRVFCDN